MSEDSKVLGVELTAKERKRLAGKRYRAKHKQKVNEYSRMYYLENKKENLKSNAEYRLRNNEKTLLSSAKYRSVKYGIEFNITLSDITIPDTCPILEIPLFKSEGKVGPNSPSLDRISPNMGYVVNNIQVISYKANTMKSDATPEELLKFARWIINEYS